MKHQFVKFANQIVNLANVTDITFTPAFDVSGSHFDSRLNICFDHTYDGMTYSTTFTGYDAERGWDWLNEHLDMTVAWNESTKVAA